VYTAAYQIVTFERIARTVARTAGDAAGTGTVGDSHSDAIDGVAKAAAWFTWRRRLASSAGPTDALAGQLAHQAALRAVRQAAATITTPEHGATPAPYLR
jgi:hypothetical protein